MRQREFTLGSYGIRPYPKGLLAEKYAPKVTNVKSPVAPVIGRPVALANWGLANWGQNKSKVASIFTLTPNSPTPNSPGLIVGNIANGAKLLGNQIIRVPNIIGTSTVGGGPKITSYGNPAGIIADAAGNIFANGVSNWIQLIEDQNGD